MTLSEKHRQGGTAERQRAEEKRGERPALQKKACLRMAYERMATVTSVVRRKLRVPNQAVSESEGIIRCV